MKKFIWAILGLVVLYGLAAFSFHLPPFSTASSDSKTITFGVMAGTKTNDQLYDLVAKNLKEQSGYTLKIKKFTDYNQPNKALTDKTIDANGFQHYAFLDSWNSKNKSDVVSAGDTYIAPIRLYSGKNQAYKSVDQLPEKATIAIPNDVSNEGRALVLLQSAGLIKLKTNDNPTVKDITDNPKQLQIKEVAADQTARSLPDVDAAVINNDFVRAANISFDSAIYTEPIDANSHKWINIIATTKANKDSKKTTALVKAFQQTNVAEFINKSFEGTIVPAWKGAPTPAGITLNF